MDNTDQKQQEQVQSDTDKPQEVAVPYVPPPPPDENQKKFRSPLVIGVGAAVVILLVGFMTYNYVGHQLTHLAGVSSVASTPTPSTTISPTP